MRAKVMVGNGWYKEFKDHTFIVVNHSESFLRVFIQDAEMSEKLVGIKDEKFLLLKKDCKIFDSNGFQVEPCEYCGTLSRVFKGNIVCDDCAKAVLGVKRLLTLSKGKEFINNIVKELK